MYLIRYIYPDTPDMRKSLWNMEIHESYLSHWALILISPFKSESRIWRFKWSSDGAWIELDGRRSQSLWCCVFTSQSLQQEACKACFLDVNSAWLLLHEVWGILFSRFWRTLNTQLSCSSGSPTSCSPTLIQYLSLRKDPTHAGSFYYLSVMGDRQCFLFPNCWSVHCMFTELLVNAGGWGSNTNKKVPAVRRLQGRMSQISKNNLDKK